MTRKTFLNTMAGATAAVALTSCAQTSAGKKGPKRGVSIYSYTGNLGIDTTLEDCFAEISDLAHDSYEMGIEILSSGHVEGYPNPSDAWVKNWHDMCAKYKVKPVEYGHWIDSRTFKGRELDVKESVEQLVRDIKLANKLGFTVGRTKLGVIDRPGQPTYNTLTPVTNWREFIKAAIPTAQQYNFRMCPEIHGPTLLKSKMIDDYVDFIEKEKTTPWFGLNIDFGVFQNKPRTPLSGMPEMPKMPFSPVADIVPLLKYVHCCHAKFVEMNDECEEVTTPYREILETLMKNNYDGYMMSEYEGNDRGVGSGSFDAVRKQHVLMRKILKEA